MMNLSIPRTVHTPNEEVAVPQADATMSLLKRRIAKKKAAKKNRTRGTQIIGQAESIIIIAKTVSTQFDAMNQRLRSRVSTLCEKILTHGEEESANIVTMLNTQLEEYDIAFARLNKFISEMNTTVNDLKKRNKKNIELTAMFQTIGDLEAVAEAVTATQATISSTLEKYEETSGMTINSPDSDIQN